MASSDITKPVSTDNPLRAQCFCGAFEMRITSPAENSYLCHCTDCRQITGSSFAHNAVFPLENVSIVKPSSEPKSEYDKIVRNTDELPYNQGNMAFCGKCGGHMLLYVPDAVEGMAGKIIVPVGVIDGSAADERLKPTSEGWCKRREAWMAKMEGTAEHQEW